MQAIKGSTRVIPAFLRKTDSRSASLRWASASSRSGSAPLKGGLTRDMILDLPSMPAISPSYPRGPYRFNKREYLIITFESDPAAIRKVLPEPLQPHPDNLVLYEWIEMPDSAPGFGSYSESGVVIPCFLNGEACNFVLSMYLNCEPPVAAGREQWGFPKKEASPSMSVYRDTLVGKLKYAGEEVALGTMSYKMKTIPSDIAAKAIAKKQINLKIIPHVDGTPRIAQLVAFHLEDVEVLGAWEGPARLSLQNHVNCPNADLPIRKIIGGKHLLANLTLPQGRVIHNYLEDSALNRELDTRTGSLTPSEIKKIPSLPIQAPSFPHSSGAQLVDREYMIIQYKSDAESIRQALPEDLVPNPDNFVHLEFVDTRGSGFGEYRKVTQSIPCTYNGKPVHFLVQSYVDNGSPITSGREILGQPQKYGKPTLEVYRDTLTGTLIYGQEEKCATATMTYKQKEMSREKAIELLHTTQVTLKVIPGPDGFAEIAELVGVEYHDINIRSAHYGPARLQFTPHINAPLADLPVLEVVEGYHIDVEKLKMGKGRVLVDYKKPAAN